MTRCITVPNVFSVMNMGRKKDNRNLFLLRDANLESTSVKIHAAVNSVNCNAYSY